MSDRIYVKIAICKKYNSNVDDVIYYRNWITVEMAEKWRWYFDYLTAIVKVKNPKYKIMLLIGIQDLKQGDEYVCMKSKTLLSSKKAQLKKILAEPAEIDLFDYKKERRDQKIKKLRAEIEALERGEFNYYIPPTYINKVKQYI